jgi:hypothetical protein
MKVAVVLPDGVAIRNFVLGSFLRDLPGEAVLLHTFSDNLLQTIKHPSMADVVWERLPPLRERVVTFTLRQSLAFAHMYWADTYSMRFNRNRPVYGSWRTKAAVRAAKSVGQCVAWVGAVELLERFYHESIRPFREVREHQRLLERIQPDVVFCANQRAASLLPLVLAAKSLSIPTATFIASWDNLTAKGRIVAPFDQYLVWGDIMRQELLRYYPSIPVHHTHIVGSPQFDCYADKSARWSREEFFRRIGADPRRALICYSGGEPSTNPEDQEHVRVLVEFIRQGRISGTPQVLLRPSPVDDGRRYQEIRERYPEIIYSQPRWTCSEGHCIPQPEDIAFLANLTKHVDLNVNNASTMTLDFGLRDRPVVNVAFDVRNPPLAKIPLWDYYYKWEHYQPVVKLGAARFARTPQELAEHVNHYLGNPYSDRDGRQQLARLQIGVPVGSSSGRIADVLQEIAN